MLLWGIFFSRKIRKILVETCLNASVSCSRFCRSRTRCWLNSTIADILMGVFMWFHVNSLLKWNLALQMIVVAPPWKNKDIVKGCALEPFRILRLTKKWFYFLLYKIISQKITVVFAVDDWNIFFLTNEKYGLSLIKKPFPLVYEKKITKFYQPKQKSKVVKNRDHLLASRKWLLSLKKAHENLPNKTYTVYITHTNYCREEASAVLAFPKMYSLLFFFEISRVLLLWGPFQFGKWW